MKETIKYFSIQEKEAPINILMTGVSVCDKNHHYTRNKPSIIIIEYVFKGEDEPLYQFAADFAKTHEVDHFIFGHYHVAVSMTLPSGSSFNILKDWIDASPYICFDGGNLVCGSL